jgi:rod shape-determining protein MreD
MKINQAKESKIGIEGIVPSLTILFFMIIMVLPYKIPIIGEVMPFLTMMGVYYWSVFKPEMLPISVVFILGIIQDVLLGSPFGLMPLLLIIIQQFIYIQGRQFLERDFIFNWFVFVMVVFGFGILSWGITSLYFRTALDFLSILAQISLTIALYPVITWLLGIVRKIIK